MGKKSIQHYLGWAENLCCDETGNKGKTPKDIFLRFFLHGFRRDEESVCFMWRRN